MRLFFLTLTYGHLNMLIDFIQEISGMPTSLKRDSFQAAGSPDAMGESSSSGTARTDRPDSSRAL